MMAQPAEMGMQLKKKDYKLAALALIANMKAATELNRGDPGVEKVKMLSGKNMFFVGKVKKNEWNKLNF